MQEGRQGVYGKTKSPYIEMGVRRSDCYKAVAERAAKKCHLIYQESKTLSLFKLNGARILDEEITIGGKTKPWTLGNYILLMKKSPNNIKLGVGCITPDSSSDVDDSDKVMTRLVSWVSQCTMLRIGTSTMVILQSTPMASMLTRNVFISGI